MAPKPDSLPPKRILLVDDTEEARYAMARILSRAGYEVFEAGSGAEALKAIDRHPELIILDVQLPDINGMELSRQFRENPFTKDLPILQVSAAFTLTTHKIQGLDAGADVYLASPVDQGELLAHIRTLLRLKQTQDTLRASEERFRLMADGTPVTIWVLDRDNRVQFVNRAYTEFFGRTAEEVKDKGWIQLVHPDDHAFVEAFLEAARTRTQFRGVARVRRWDGAWRWFESNAVPQLSDSGEFLGMVGSSMDVTERQEFEKELERKVAERTRSLEETTRQLNDFCYSVAHDLKAPIRAQSAFAHALLEDFGPCLGEEGSNYAERIRDAAQRQDRLVADLLAHISLGQAEMPLEPVDLGPVLDTVRKDLEVEIHESRAKVDISQVSGSVMANRSSLHLVLANLLTNALKFVAHGQIPEIRCWTEAPPPVTGQSPVLRLWVQDRGIGISEKHVHKVFGVFQRLHTREQYPGTGIGLAIVKRAVERMGGKVGFDSVEGQGSRFWVELAKA